MQSIVEKLREEAIKNLFSMETFRNCWATWKAKITSLADTNNPNEILDLGDNLADIFRTTNTGRTQGGVSGGGAAWEALVCYYLNLCLIGQRVVVIKQSKRLLPLPIYEAIQVNYGSFISNTESDLVAIVFPDKTDYLVDKDGITGLYDAHGNLVALRNKTYNTMDVLNALCNKDFSDYGIHIIQCKTNWNDNAQIPMLWDMVYSANNFKSNVKVGTSKYSIHSLKDNAFSYSFVTVPTVDRAKIKPSSVCVKRVKNISGRNYWGHQTKSDVALSIKELPHMNFSAALNRIPDVLSSELPKLSSAYMYFEL